MLLAERRQLNRKVVRQPAVIMLGLMRRRLAYERSLPAVMQAARQRAGARLRARPPAYGWPEIDLDPELGRRLFRGLADLIAVEPESLRPEDTLQDLLVVHREELGGISAKTCRLAGFNEQVQPYAYDLMQLFEHGSNRRAWTAQWKRIEPRPQNEEQWIDYLMSLTVQQFIRLAVAVRKPTV